MLTSKQAADYLGYSVKYLYKLVHYGIIPYCKPNGGKLMFDQDKLKEWVNNGSNYSDRISEAATYTECRYELINKLREQQAPLKSEVVTTTYEVKELSATQNEIKSQIADALITLGAKSDLISVVMSWGDTLSEQDVLDNLKTWNTNNQPQHQRKIKPAPNL